MRTPTRLHALLATLLVTAVLAGACGSSDDGPEAAPATTSPTDGDDTATEPASVPDEEPEVDPTATSVPEPTPTVQYNEVLGWQSMMLLTPIEGEGSRPVFSWESVPEVDRYFLTLLDAAGAGYWSWEGEGTEIVLGGLPVLEDGIAGPQVSPGMTWSVTAVDVDGQVIALSEFRPISP